METIRLTGAQQEAVASAGRSTAIVAGAGSGKTAVIVERAAMLLRSGSIGPENLCCITFTERAATELKSRIWAAVTDRYGLDISRAQISTFHSAQGRILKEQAATAGIDPGFATMDETAATLLLSRIVRVTVIDRLSVGDDDTAKLVDAYRFGYVTEKIRDLVEERWDRFRWNPAPELPAAEEEECTYLATIRRLTDEVESAYEAAKRRTHQCDFVDLEMVTCGLLEKHTDVRTAYQRFFKVIIVDEAQDINVNQENFCRLLYAPGINSLTIVGDPKQSIYRFRGADVLAFERLLQHIEKTGGKRIDLLENHRSHPAICSFVNTASRGMKWFEELVPTKNDDGENRIIPLRIPKTNPDEKMDISSRRDAEAARIAGWINAAGDGKGWKEIALLFVSKADMHRYADALQRLNIPMRVHSGSGFLERPEILDITAALRATAHIASRKPCNSALLRLLRSPLVGLTDDECYRLVFPDLTRTDLPALELPEAALRHATAGPLLRKWIDASAHVGVADLIELIVESTEYASHICSDNQALANVEKLYWLAWRQDIPLAEWMTYLDELSRREARIPDQPIGQAMGDCVHLMTIHAAKGLEFSTVILPDLLRRPRADYEAWLSGPSLGLGLKLPDPADPLAQKIRTAAYEAIHEAEQSALADERQRLLYVALTRARDRIVLPLHDDVTNDKGTWHELLSQIVHR